MKTKILLLIRLLLVTVGVCQAQTKQELAYDVIGAQMKASMYIMEVDAGSTGYNMRVDQGYQMDVRNACLLLTDNYDSMRRCKALVCYHTGIPFSSCFSR